MYIIKRSYLAEHRRAWLVVYLYTTAIESHGLAAARRGLFRTRAAAQAWVDRYGDIFG